MPAPDDKTGLRPRLRALRRALARAAPQAGALAADRLPADALPSAAVVGGYLAQGSEIDPVPLMARLAADGARLALPVALGSGQPLAFRLWRPGDPLEPDAAGLPAPVASAPPASPRVVITALLAFDRQGGRLGQGGGYYDRTLANLRDAGPVFALGLAYAGQELPAVPAEAHDARLDAILTETDYIPVARKT